MAIFVAEPPQRAHSNVLPFTRKLAAATELEAAVSSPTAADTDAHPAAAASPAPSSVKAPGSPSRAIPSLGPRPTFLESSARGAFGDFAGSSPPIGFDDVPPCSAEVPLPAGSPASEKRRRAGGAICCPAVHDGTCFQQVTILQATSPTLALGGLPMPVCL